MSWWAIDVRTAPRAKRSAAAPGWWLGPDRRWKSGTTAPWSPSQPTRPAPRRWSGELGREVDPAAGDRSAGPAGRRGLVHPLARRPGSPAARPAHRGPLLDPGSRRSRPAHRRARSGDRVRQRGARLHPRRADPAERLLQTRATGCWTWGAGAASWPSRRSSWARPAPSGSRSTPKPTGSACRNADRNGVADRVEFLEGDAGALAPLAGPADLILSNILRTVNTALLPSIARCTPARGVGHLLRNGAARGDRVPRRSHRRRTSTSRGGGRHRMVGGGCRAPVMTVLVAAGRSAVAGERASLDEQRGASSPGAPSPGW